MMCENQPGALIKMDLGSLTQTAHDPIHLLPCEIQYDGHAAVDKYFTPTICQGVSAKEVSFRGRPLKGQEIKIPAGYIGLVVEENHRPCSEEEGRTVCMKSTFLSFTQWNLETLPSADDCAMMSLMWPKISEAIHRPVDSEE
ncbi:ribonuclease H2 subunit C [Microcaecilia unicolor]|uniref:Ribonuclease H2 subunit C n=1 Tax=Microcaecilia unicolor TaxID=1415580 RepID=A0A6P7ZBF5_9AMPH|nr:ribonuclease H2 subunit C [Microcaecilia unicolor]XP_030074979.1 ribonuclease H2 subunit C [Microcaecilia unicolor]XP_030074980.1 ribonuclease H2 subunit C [Microcaecilia unicolor]